MSLIISMKVPDCIVVASDSCMTLTTTQTQNDVKQVTAMSHTEHTSKMVVFRERLVVTYCDAMFVNRSLSVLQFLRDLRQSVSKNITPKQLAERIIQNYAKSTDGRRTVFIISGYMSTNAEIFRFNTINNEIESCMSEGFGAAFNGETIFVKKMMDSVANYRNISPKDAVQLVSTMMDCMASLSKFWESQSIGGDIDLYIMFRDKSSKSGWVRAGQAIPLVPYGYKNASFT